MPAADEHLRLIDEQLRRGATPPRETVRGFLLWFGANRRGVDVVRRARAELARFDLETEPDFETAYIDDAIRFIRARRADDPARLADDPIDRIGRLDSANRRPLSVRPDATLAQATTLMLAHGYSQLPVMTTDREVKGVVSWRSIGTRLVLGRDGATASDFMDEARIVSADTSIFEVVKLVSEEDYALVRGRDRTIRGIVTTTDLSLQFRNLAEPFLLIGDIENHLRKLIHEAFTVEELNALRDPGDAGRVVESVSDLGFGEYIRIVENADRWERLNLRIDRAEFVRRLERTREIRNDVMHFDPEGLSDEDFTALREFARFLRRLRAVGAI